MFTHIINYILYLHNRKERREATIFDARAFSPLLMFNILMILSLNSTLTDNIMDDFLNLAVALTMDGLTVNNLNMCDRNFDRICLMRNIFSMRHLDDKFDIPNKPKDNKRSEIFRLLGNKLFFLQKWFDALEYYNKSICFATKDSTELSIGYANRSAVYFELKEYTLCLENISFAKAASGFPDRLMNKLNQRELDCLSLMENATGNPDNCQLGKEEPKLSRKAHPQVPFIIDCLEMKTNLKEGRHIITNEDLKPGEIVAIEDAFVCGPDEGLNYRRCTYCTKENMLSLMPCDECTNTMFCAECLTGATEDFHKIECNISYFLAAFEKTRFVLRLVLRALDSFASIDEIAEFLHESPEHTVFSFDQTAGTVNEKQKYLSVHSLVLTNEEKQSESDVLLRTMYSTILIEKLVFCTDFEEMYCLDTMAGKVVLADIINHSFQVVPQNGHMITCCDANDRAADIGGAIYPFSSLLNHSCSPNVFRISCGTKLLFVALRNIGKGEQLLDCYTYEAN